MKNGKLFKEAVRIVAAFGHACDGLKAAWAQPAFRTEILLTIIFAPLAFFLTKNGLQRAVMIGSLMIVLITELLNTGIETAIDRISSEWHPLSKRAKDVGSAAVLISLVNAGMVWLVVLSG